MIAREIRRSYCFLCLIALTGCSNESTPEDPVEDLGVLSRVVEAPEVKKLAPQGLPEAILPQRMTSEEQFVEARRTLEDHHDFVSEKTGIGPRQQHHIERLPDCLLAININGQGWSKFYANGILSLHRIDDTRTAVNFRLTGTSKAVINAVRQDGKINVHANDAGGNRLKSFELWDVDEGKPNRRVPSSPVLANQVEVEAMLESAFEFEVIN